MGCSENLIVKNFYSKHFQLPLFSLDKISYLTNTIFETGSFESEISEMPVNAQYLLRVSESGETFRPIWCVFNGFWWWRFYVSIVDQHNGDEILTWTGRGCANSTLRKMDKILDKLEIKEKNE